MRSFIFHYYFSIIIIFISKITKLTESNFVKWLINIWALLWWNKFWKYVQKNASKKMKNMNIKKWKKTTNIMILTLLFEIKKKLIEKKFNNEFKMLTRLTILLQLKNEIQFIRLICKYYILCFDKSSLKILSKFITWVKVLEECIDVINVTMNNNKYIFLLSVNESVIKISLSHTNLKCNEQNYSRKDNSNAAEREVKNKEWFKAKNRIWVSVCSSCD